MQSVKYSSFVILIMPFSKEDMQAVHHWRMG